MLAFSRRDRAAVRRLSRRSRDGRARAARLLAVIRCCRLRVCHLRCRRWRAGIALLRLSVLVLRAGQWFDVPARAASLEGQDRVDVGDRGRGGRYRRFYLPVIMGMAKESTGSYQMGFATFGVLAVFAFGFLLALRSQWLQLGRAGSGGGWARRRDARWCTRLNEVARLERKKRRCREEGIDAFCCIPAAWVITFRLPPRSSPRRTPPPPPRHPLPLPAPPPSAAAAPTSARTVRPRAAIPRACRARRCAP